MATNDVPLVQAVLAEAALDGSRPWVPVRELGRLSARLAGRPRRTAGHLARQAVELARIGAGTSSLAPDRDGRFRDPTWSSNPVWRRVAQTYLLAARAVDDMIAQGELDWRSERRMRLAAANLLDALAPTNNPALNPVVLKAAFDSGGRTLLRGARNLASDLVRPGESLRLPTMVDLDAYRVGETIAASPGAVVARTEMFELLQYSPTTASVRERPLLILPSTINKFYVFDLTQDRSAIAHAVASGHQVFAISWRNPGREQAGWDLEAYVAAGLEALSVVEDITGARGVHLATLCAGGLIGAVLAAHLAARGDAERLATLTGVVSVLDHARMGDVGALVDDRAAEMAIGESARRGYVDGEALAGVFAWLRPHDRVWRYWVHNYLLGKEPSASDILYWNADTANLSAGFHRDMLELAVGNALTRPGALAVLGTPIDLAEVRADAYLVAGRTDHLTPWHSCWRSTELLGGTSRFVLVNSGHVTTVVSPPGDDRAAYWSADGAAADARAWLDGAAHRRGSWWEDWIAWLHERGGGRKRARRALGSRRFPVLGPAPGTYVRG